jgi:hypothetical protein
MSANAAGMVTAMAQSRPLNAAPSSDSVALGAASMPPSGLMRPSATSELTEAMPTPRLAAASMPGRPGPPKRASTNKAMPKAVSQPALRAVGLTRSEPAATCERR